MTRTSAGTPLDGSGPIQHVGSLAGRHADPAGDIDRIPATQIHRRRTAQIGDETLESPSQPRDERGRHLLGMHRHPDVGHWIIVRANRRHRKPGERHDQLPGGCATTSFGVGVTRLTTVPSPGNR